MKNNQLKICQLVDLANIGGAGIAAQRIANTISETLECEIFQVSTSAKNNGLKQFSLNYSRKIQFLNFFSKYLSSNFLSKVSVSDLRNQLSKILKKEKPQIINIHNLHSAGWPISLVQSCLNYSSVPVVWTLHDCWSFSGSYYPSYCPSPNKRLEKELNQFWKCSNNRLSAITPSNWLKEEACNGDWANHKVSVIPHPAPESFFISRDQKSCKKALGLNENLPTILCIAGNLNEERKGGSILQKILASNITESTEFLLIGNGKDYQGKNIKNLGFIEDEITLQIAYNAADILLHTAPIDNLPNTVLESIACGTPVLAINCGGVSDMVKINKSGWLVDKPCANELAKKLSDIINTRDYMNLKGSSKSFAQENFNTRRISLEYSKLFNELLK